MPLHFIGYYVQFFVLKIRSQKIWTFLSIALSFNFSKNLFQGVFYVQKVLTGHILDNYIEAELVSTLSTFFLEILQHLHICFLPVNLVQAVFVTFSGIFSSPILRRLVSVETFAIRGVTIKTPLERNWKIYLLFFIGLSHRRDYRPIFIYWLY